MTLIAWIIIGGLAGWIASKLMGTDAQQGLLLNILVGIGGWIGVPVTAGLDLNDKFGAIGATAMTKAANLDKIPQAGTLFTFRVYE